MKARARGEAGESLVEVLATVSIMAIASVAVVTGIGAATRFSSSDRGGADALVVVSRAAEAVKAASVEPSCPLLAPATYAETLSSLTDLPPGWTTADVAVTSAACTTVGGVSVPHVTVTATAPGRDTSASVVVVPRW